MKASRQSFRLFLVALLLPQYCHGFVASKFNNGKSVKPAAFLSSSSTASEEQINPSKAASNTLPWTMDVERFGPFRQEEEWAFVYSSTPREEASTTYEIEDIEGEIPADLKGTFYKVGPGKFERSDQAYEHVLDGDGFITAITLDGSMGTARYTGRFVETEYFLKEDASDTVQYRNVFGTQRKGGPLANAFDLTLKNVANTNVVQWGGRLFVFWEAGRPYELDPETLETLCPIEDVEDGPFQGLGGMDCKIRGITIDKGGPIDALAKVGRSFTAHPHVWDDDTLVAFKTETNAQTKVLQLEFVEYNQEWKELSSQMYTVAGSPPPHDFSVADDFYAFFENPYGAMDNLPYLFGLKAPTQIMQLALRQPTRLHLVPRPSSGKNQEALVVDLPASYFNIHIVGISQCREEEEGRRLHLYSTGWDLTDERYFPQTQDSAPFLGAWGGSFPDFTNGIVPPSLLYHTVVDVDNGQVISHEEIVPGMTVEFPTQEGASDKILYGNVASTDYTSLPGTGLLRVDTETKDHQVWWANGGIFTHEVIPVPKESSEGDKQADEYWLLTPLYDARNQRVSLAIFDSVKFEKGPVCQMHLKHHVTYGLHSSFCPSPKTSTR